MSEIIIQTVRDYLMLQDDSFDETVLININTALFGLFQMGQLPSMVVNEESLWTDLGVDDVAILNLIKNSICLKVKLLFDSDKVSELVRESLDELDARLMTELDVAQSG